MEFKKSTFVRPNSRIFLLCSTPYDSEENMVQCNTLYYYQCSTGNNKKKLKFLSIPENLYKMINIYLILLIILLTRDRKGGDRTDLSLKLEKYLSSRPSLTLLTSDFTVCFQIKIVFVIPASGQFQSLLFPENLFACFSKLFCQFKDRDGKE